MISINAQKKRVEPGAFAIKGREIGVDEELLHELGKQYEQYRQALTGPFDPITVLALTGNVLEAVNRMLTSAIPTVSPPQNSEGSGNDRQ